MEMRWKDIAEKMEKFSNSEKLVFKIRETFGGGVAVLSLNPNHPGKGQKKYMLKLGKEESLAEQSAPYYMSDKPKDLARWVADRHGETVD